jgi:spore germination cell wall hydrolase CwlJ-like protein
MSVSRISWAIGVIAPWCLGAGLLVSFTADAGQDFAVGASLAPIESRAPRMPDDLVPGASMLAGNLGPAGTGRGLLREARLAIGPIGEFHTAPDEMTPRIALKPNTHHFPIVDRAHRGDPSVGLRPSFDAQLRRRGGYADFMASDAAFHIDEWSPTSTFAPADGDAGGPDAVSQFEPWADEDVPTSSPPAAGSSTSPSQGASVVTMRPAALSMRLAQGASPAVPRAAALESTTPAPADSVPVEIVALPALEGPAGQHIPEATTVPRGERPAYASLIGSDARERRCLAEAVYFEARSEPEEGQAAVAQVVLNRAASGLYPNNICGVVFQNRHRYKACQFSFACEGKSLRVQEPDAWATAVRIANSVMDGKTYLSDVGRATHYHANYVRPRWARRLKKMETIGHHIFYALRPGQT